MATNAKLMKEINEQFLICKICYEPYKNPKTLTCLHTFCSNCLQKHIDSEQERSTRYSLYGRYLFCPICSKKTEIPTGGIRRLLDNFLVSNLTDVVNRLKTSKIPPCEICHMVRTRSNEACSKCLECSKVLCKSCVKLHMNTKVTQNHSLFDLEGEKDIECKSHSGEIVRFYCEPCDECICVVCTFQEHRDHEICSFSEGSAKYKSSIESLVNQCKERLMDLRVRLGMIGKCESALKETRERIRDLAISYIAQVRQTEKQLLQRVDAMFGDDILDFLDNKSWLQENFDNLQNTCNLAEIVMKDKGVEILLLKKELQNKLGFLLEPDLPKVPDHLATNIKFIPGFVKLGHLSVTSGEDDSGETSTNSKDLFTMSQNSSNNRQLCTVYKNSHSQTDFICFSENSTTMNAHVNVESAAAQTAKVETVSRLTGTDTRHTRDKSTEIQRIDPKTRGTMTEYPDSRLQNLSNDRIPVSSKTFNPLVPLSTRSTETEIKFLPKDEFSVEDISLLQRVKTYGFEVRSAPKPTTRSRKVQTDDTPPTPPPTPKTITINTISTNAPLPLPMPIMRTTAHETKSGSSSPVIDRRARRLSGDIVAIRQRFGDSKPLRRQESLKESPSPDSSESTSNSSSGSPSVSLVSNGTAVSVQNGPLLQRPQRISIKHAHVQTSQVEMVSSCTGPDKTAYCNSTTLTDRVLLQDAVTDTESLTIASQSDGASLTSMERETVPQVHEVPNSRQRVIHRGSSPVFTFDPLSLPRTTRVVLSEPSDKPIVVLADAYTETETQQTRDSETLTAILSTVENWTLTNRTECVNSGTSPVMTPTREVGISTLNPVLVHQGMATTQVECVDSETETCLFMQDNETLTDKVQSTDAQTNIQVHRQDGITWVDCSENLEPGARTETATGTSTDDQNASEDEGRKENGDSEEDVFFEIHDDDDDDDDNSPMTNSLATGSSQQRQHNHQQQHQHQEQQQQQQQQKQSGNGKSTMTLPDAVENHNTTVCNMCSLHKPRQIHRATMSSPTPTHDQGTMVLSFSTSSMEFIDRGAQTTQAVTADKSIEAVFSEPPPGSPPLASPDYNDAATSTESLPYMGLLSEVDLNELYLMPDSAFELHSDTDTANSECESDMETEMVDQETWMENCQNVEVGTQTANFVSLISSNPEQSVSEITSEMLDDGSKDLVSIGVNTMPKVTYEKETSTQSRYLFSKGTMTFYINKSDKSTSTLSGSNRSSIVSRNSLVVDRCDKDTMTSGCGVMDKAVSTDFTQLNEQVANCITKLRNVHDRLQSPTTKQVPDTELSPKSSLARKNKPKMDELLGAPTTPITSTSNVMTSSVPPVSYALTSSTPAGATSTTTASINILVEDGVMRPVSAFDSIYPGGVDVLSTPSITLTMSTASPTFMTSTSMSQSLSLLPPQVMATELRPARDRVTVRKAQPITTLKCRYKDMNVAKSQSLPRQFMSPTSDLNYQQQQQQQQQLLQMQQQQAGIRFGSQMASPPSRLPLLRYNSAPGRIVTVPKQSTPKDFTVSSAQTSPTTNSKIPTTRKACESQKETMKDYYTITNGKAKNQLPSLPAITETRTPSLCSDSSGGSSTSWNSSSVSGPASTSATSMLTWTSTPTSESESPASLASSPSSSSAVNFPTSPTSSHGISAAVDPLNTSSEEQVPSKDYLSPTSAVSSLVMAVSSPVPESRDSSPQTRKGGFMQRLLSRKPKKDTDSSKQQSSRLSTHSVSSTSSASSALSTSASRKSTSPKSPGKTAKSKTMTAPPSPAPSSSSASPSPKPMKGRGSSKSSSPDPDSATEKTAKPKKNHPFVYVRQRIFAIQHDGDEEANRKSRTHDRNQKKVDKKSEKVKGSPSPSAVSSSSSKGRRMTPPKQNPTEVKKEKSPPRSAIPIPEGQSFADVC